MTSLLFAWCYNILWVIEMKEEILLTDGETLSYDEQGITFHQVSYKYKQIQDIHVLEDRDDTTVSFIVKVNDQEHKLTCASHDYIKVLQLLDDYSSRDQKRAPVMETSADHAHEVKQDTRKHVNQKPMMESEEVISPQVNSMAHAHKKSHHQKEGLNKCLFVGFVIAIIVLIAHLSNLSSAFMNSTNSWARLGAVIAERAIESYLLCIGIGAVLDLLAMLSKKSVLAIFAGVLYIVAFLFAPRILFIDAIIELCLPLILSFVGAKQLS